MWVLVGVGVLMTAIAAYLAVRSQSQPAPPASLLTAFEDPGAVRILAGYSGPETLDSQGHRWSADRFFSGGTSTPIPDTRFIEGQRDPHLIRSLRSGAFRYDIPLAPGLYELHLLFAETEYGSGNPAGGGEATRLFNVSVNGVRMLGDFDPLGDVGAPNRMDEKVFSGISPGSDGKLHLGFEPGNGSAFLNGIEILPSRAGRIRPVRIVAQPASFKDSLGQFWAADGYVVGGRLASRTDPVVNAADQSLYRGERYGNFSYHLPLAPGHYRLTLYFAEQWFGTAASVFAPVTRRSFSVYANHQTLLQDFQPGVVAGGANRAISKVFNNVQPDGHGKLHLEFVPMQNYAELNALEIVQTE
jgi:hypothetical protein